MATVNIAGIDKVSLLEALWNNMKPAPFFERAPIDPPPFDRVEAETVVTADIDYFCGRRIKTDIRGDVADPRRYDHHAGDGAFARIVASLREN